MLERILYVSRASSGIELADVFEIAQKAGPCNAKAGLSGALVFVDGWIAQVLEGPAPALCATYTRILKDPRHCEISFRTRERGLCPLFGGQGLILRTATTLDPEILPEFNYQFGFPVEIFPADVLLEFIVCAARARDGAAWLDRRRAVS